MLIFQKILLQSLPNLELHSEALGYVWSSQQRDRWLMY